MRLERFCDQITGSLLSTMVGSVKRVRRESLRVSLPNVRVGSLCQIESGKNPVFVEIVSLDPAGHVAMPLDELGDVRLGQRVSVLEESASLAVGEGLLGRVIDSLGRPYDGLGPLTLNERTPLYGTPSNPMERVLISQPLDLGIRSVNACLSCGKGQRTGIFAGSGVGKSVLLGMMARFTAADVVVISLIGERGREVREFIENDLGNDGLKKSVVVVETAEKSAVRRSRGAFAATAVAEHFRKKGAHVLLLMDSLTRLAMAQREIGIAAGEPPTTKGYTPSVFSNLARVAERAGNWGDGGSITGLYTVLVEGDDLDEPVADHARAILDGHIVLSRKLANRGHYPAVDILASISRVMDKVVSNDHLKSALILKRLLSTYTENEDAIQMGLYVPGTNDAIDRSVELEPKIRDFLRQGAVDHADFGSSSHDLLSLVS